jgi:hypothetical protein
MQVVANYNMILQLFFYSINNRSTDKTAFNSYAKNRESTISPYHHCLNFRLKVLKIITLNTL